MGNWPEQCWVDGGKKQMALWMQREEFYWIVVASVVLLPGCHWLAQAAEPNCRVALVGIIGHHQTVGRGGHGRGILGRRRRYLNALGCPTRIIGHIIGP